MSDYDDLLLRLRSVMTGTIEDNRSEIWSQRSDAAIAIANLRAEIERLTRERDELMESLKSACNDRHEANVIALNVQEERDDYKARAESAESTVASLRRELEDKDAVIGKQAREWAKQNQSACDSAHIIIESGIRPGIDSSCRCESCRRVAISMDEAGYLDGVTPRWWVDDSESAAIASTQEVHR